MLQIEYDLQEQDLTAFTEHELQDKEHFQKVLRRHEVLLPAIMALLAFFVWFYYGNVPGAIYIGLMAILWRYVAPLIIKYNIRRRTLKLYSAEDIAQLTGHYKLVLEPQALLLVRGKEETRFPWRDLIRIEDTKKYIFIYLDVDQALIVPKKQAKGDLKKFVEIARKRIAAAE
ncbi:hypothetical protein MIT9_P2540 [Methylomarinovum caldicuralii]|uniref:YcxB-like C-terminal domain-containing protein n=1 Tax=Methylomarinovum caldicuralii TaxID=438856 RepID=A0AAU9CA76_9GAMM|nr:YcxB family protein [Methylomarinovum caldicuralii]BCX82949.1 hypothetical protein MIT9_P2540 [Methylomarinovum caldicuralii]